MTGTMAVNEVRFPDWVLHGQGGAPQCKECFKVQLLRADKMGGPLYFREEHDPACSGYPMQNNRVVVMERGCASV